MFDTSPHADFGSVQALHHHSKAAYNVWLAEFDNADDGQVMTFWLLGDLGLQLGEMKA